MIKNSNSIGVICENNEIQIFRKFKFVLTQWVLVIFLVFILLSLLMILYVLNKARIEYLFSSDETSPKVLLGSVLLFLFSFFIYLFINVVRVTMRISIKLLQGKMLVNSAPFSNLETNIFLSIKRNVGWRGLGVSYTIVLNSDRRKVYIAYYLSKIESEIFIMSLIDALESKGVILKFPDDQIK